MLSALSGARPRFVWTMIPVALITGVMRDARRRSRLDRISATIASAPGMTFDDRRVCRYRRTAGTTTGAGSPVSPNDCRILSTEGIARRREAFAGFTKSILSASAIERQRAQGDRGRHRSRRREP